MEIAAYPEFQKNDFTVVAQPILINFTLPVESNGHIDMSSLSVDCLHPSQKSYALCKFIFYIIFIVKYIRCKDICLCW